MKSSDVKSSLFKSYYSISINFHFVISDLIQGIIYKPQAYISFIIHRIYINISNKYEKYYIDIKDHMDAPERIIYLHCFHDATI